MENKELQQFTTAKKSVELLFDQVQQCVSLFELNQLLTNFNTYILKIANNKNNRSNKNITAFVQYFVDQKKNIFKDKTNIIKKEILHNIKYRVSYKDYKSELLSLRERGLSYQKISSYAYKYWKIKVSKDTIRNFLNAK